MRQKLASITQSLRLPSICTLCHQFHNNSLAVCLDCINLMTPIGPCCQHCAHPIDLNSYSICGVCINNPPYFDKAIIAYQFEEPLRSLIHRFKYYNGLFLGSFLSELMLHGWEEQMAYSECLIPVPMHPKKIKARGFNQAAILAKKLSKALKIPYDMRSCTKIVNTEPQANLDAEQRQYALNGAFLAKPIPYKHVTLIDDLLTTGSTANELARVLKDTGVQRVDVWCCARTISRD